MWDRFWDQVAASWPVISAAPLPLLALAGAEAAMVWGVARFLYKHKEEVAQVNLKHKDDATHAHILLLEAQITSKQALADQYLAQLGLQAAQGRAAGLTVAELKQRALGFVHEARAWLVDVQNREEVSLTRQHHANVQAGKDKISEEERDRRWQVQSDERSREYSKVVSDWESRFKIPAMLWRDELLKRVRDVPVEDAHIQRYYELPINRISMSRVVDDLQRMATSL